MREILFRGKRMDNGEWVEGSLLKVTINGKTAYLIFGDNFSFDGNDVKALSHALVDPDTVGQYTGLNDKNGNRIFEGDIAESIYTKRPYIVCFGEYTYTDDWGDQQPACGWYNIEEGGYITAFGNPDDWATVIGNIHDNPELIGGAE